VVDLLARPPQQGSNPSQAVLARQPDDDSRAAEPSFLERVGDVLYGVLLVWYHGL